MVSFVRSPSIGKPFTVITKEREGRNTGKPDPSFYLCKYNCQPIKSSIYLWFFVLHITGPKKHTLLDPPNLCQCCLRNLPTHNE